MKHSLSALLLLAGLAHAQPTVRSILNNASYIVPPLPGASIAQGSIFAVFGTGMGPAALVQAGFPLPTELSGTSIRISASGTDVSAFLIYTSAGQLAGILPSTTPVGPAVARVTYNGVQGAIFSFNVVRSSPGLFTLNGGGTGPAVLTTPDFKVITYTNAAVVGDVLSAWATGITPLQGRADNTAAEFFDPQLAVEVIVGGKQANIRYRGRAPGLAGLDQIVFDVPAGVSGCNVSLALRVGGVISNFSTLAVGGPSRLCSDPNGLSESDISRALQNGLRLGSISLGRVRSKIAVPGIGSIESRVDVAAADFTSYDVNSFIRSTGAGAGSLSPGNCIVTTFSGENAPVDPFAAVKLNAGTPISITGPSGTRTMVRNANGTYSAALGQAQVIPGIPSGNTLFLEPGAYTVTGPGGPDVGSFTARLTIPQPLTTNLDSIASVARGAALNVTWTGGNASSEYVVIAGSSIRRNPTAGASFACVERASAGSFQVPAEVLLALPPSESIEGVPLGSLVVISSPFTENLRFTASGLDVGFIYYSSSESKSLLFQ